MPRLALSLLLLAVTAFASPPPGPSSPAISSVSLVAPDIIALTIDARRVIPGRLEKYTPLPGDKKVTEHWPDHTVRRALLIRDGHEIGWLLGRDLDQLSTFEGIEGDPLADSLALDPASFRISSSDDPAWTPPRSPLAVHRKSIPVDWQMRFNAFPVRHTLNLRLDRPLLHARSYRLDVSGLNISNPSASFTLDPSRLRSEAVHVNQIGFRPDDPAKLAFLSVWLGDGGSLSYPADLQFSVIDDASAREVFRGPVQLRLASDQTEKLGPGEPQNHSKTAVYSLDFSPLSTPGRYRVVVDGIGCSYPFDISPDAWKKAFTTQMRGLFHNRSGIALGPPFTSFLKPRDFHPADGSVVTRSSCDPMTEGDENFAAIVRGDTGEPVPDAWGAYHDAGDWNPRRASHLPATMAQLELLELFPSFFSSLPLGIPPTPGQPDLLTEALYGIDFFRRLQLPDGSVPFGIETDGDPEPGEVSWLSTMHAYVLAPNIRDTWHHAAAAARVSRLLQTIDLARAAIYLDSSRRAFDWAEARYTRLRETGALSRLKDLWRATDHRNFSALLLYDITGDQRYHDIFREDTCLHDPYTGLYYWGKFIQNDAAFYYARLPDSKADPVLKKAALAAILRAADASLLYGDGNAFHVTTPDKYRPVFGGFFSISGGMELVRAHFLTHDPRYLAAAIRSCLFQSGGNPNNIVYTSGLGANPIRHPLHLDSRSTGQPVPEGFTTFGNVDYWTNKGEFFTWPLAFISRPGVCYPDPYSWPLTEAYFDIFLYVGMNEFVIDTWAPNILVWGYLAARPSHP